jgi:hypothetical protein
MSANADIRPEPEGAPSPQQVLDLLTRVSAEADDVRRRLLVLTDELDATAARLRTLVAPPAPRLTAVADAPAVPLAAAPAPAPVELSSSPAAHVAVEMAVAGFTRAETQAKLTDAFAIADPTAILDEVFGAR